MNVSEIVMKVVVDTIAWHFVLIICSSVSREEYEQQQQQVGKDMFGMSMFQVDSL